VEVVVAFAIARVPASVVIRTAEPLYLQLCTLELKKIDRGRCPTLARNATPFATALKAKADLQRERGNSPSAAQFWWLQ